MRAMIATAPNRPLVERELNLPQPGPRELLVRVSACGVCRTDLHVLDGELPHPKPNIIPGHEIVGVVAATGSAVCQFRIGDRVGIPWLGQTCGQCKYCGSGRENLCDEAVFTGYTRDGGYAEFTLAHESYCLPIPETYGDVEAAPLLCAGLIGYRCWKMVGDARRIGIYGFGAAAHIIAQVARYESREIFAFTRPGDREAQQFATSLGACWAGDSNTRPPQELDAAIIFAPVGQLVPQALSVVAKGGTVVCGGIHMSDIPSFPYDLLWGERVVRSVANLTRADGVEFLALAPKIPIRPHPVVYPLAEANVALSDLRNGRLQGAAVLLPWSECLFQQ